VNVGSVRELEARNAVERKELIQAFFEHLNETSVKAELQQEPAVNCLGKEVFEPVIHLKEQNLDTIRLVGIDGGGCGVPGDGLRFQYVVHPDKNLTTQEMKDINSFTRVIKDGKVMNYFGGKVSAVKWVGQKLAETLNSDQEVSKDLMKCVKVWSHLEFQIEAVSSTEVSILGPRFGNPGMISESYHSENKEEIESCAFAYSTMENIARHIKFQSSRN
jgi:hypothetical protein